MKSSTAIAVWLTLATSAPMAQPVKVAPRMSGQQLVDQFRGPPGEFGNMSARTFAYHQLARGYLDGINDATEGALWCYTGRWKPDERDNAVILELSKLPPAALQGNAAPLVLAFLQRNYPCPTNPAAKVK